MKKKILLLAAVVTVSAAASWNLSQNRSETALTDVTLANVEALAQEGGGIVCRQSLDRPNEYCNIHTDGIYCPCGW
jgi:hypothetical protein